MSAQILGGIASGIISTTAMAIMTSFSSTERDKYIGLVEASNGLGLLCGPLGGGLLYWIGEFPLPFFFFATMLAICFPFISCVLYSANQEIKSS